MLYNNFMIICEPSQNRHINWSCRNFSQTWRKLASTITHEDNVIDALPQLKEWNIKGDNTNHILSKFFFHQWSKKECDLNVQEVRSHENLEDIFINSFSRKKLSTLLTRLNFVMLKITTCMTGRNNALCTFFLLVMVLPHWIFLARFIMRQEITYWRMMYSFSFTRFLSHEICPNKVLTKHILK